jgi:hypothetical protein
VKWIIAADAGAPQLAKPRTGGFPGPLAQRLHRRKTAFSGFMLLHARAVGNLALPASYGLIRVLNHANEPAGCGSQGLNL